MSRDDSFALLVSLAVHALLLLLFFTFALDSRQELEPPAPRMVEIEFGQTPVRPVLTGPPQQAEAGDRAAARQNMEPERPAPPASSPVRPPERPRPTPPRETPPIPRSSQTPNASPQRPSPPSSQTRPEPNPTPPRQPEPTRGNGAGGGDSPVDGRAEEGTGQGSGGDAPVQVGFDFGNRSYRCPDIDFSSPTAASYTVTYRITFSPSGRVVSVRPTRRSGIPELNQAAERAARACSAQPLPSNATQTNQSLTQVWRR